MKSSPNDLSKPERQMTYWRALESVPDLEIIKGCFKKRQVKGKLLQPIGRGIRKGEIVEIQKYEEKESDVNIASHILLDCCREDIECIVLLSNDTDLKMPLRFARKQFEKRIGIISPNPNIHQDLKKIGSSPKSMGNSQSCTDTRRFGPKSVLFTDCCEESFRSGVELPRSTRKMTDDCAWDNAIHFQEGVIFGSFR